MKRLRSRLSYANVIATLALFLALGGGAYAAIKLPKNSVGSKQIKKNAVTSAKVKNGSLTAKDFKPGQIPAGPAGATGPKGADGVVQTARWAGQIETVEPTEEEWIFAGPTASVTVNASQRLTGAATGSLGASTPGTVDVALCYQAGSSEPQPFNDPDDFTVVDLLEEKQSYGAANSFVPAAGTYTVGFCVDTFLVTVDRTDWSTGWVVVTNN